MKTSKTKLILTVPEKNTSLTYEQEEPSYNEISSKYNCMVTPINSQNDLSDLIQF